jgi:hypothetical protein
MSRLTGADAYGLMEAYQAVYAPQELTEEQVWEEVETWVNSLLEEGYDLSDYTWEEMYESYIEENTTGGIGSANRPGTAAQLQQRSRNVQARNGVFGQAYRAINRAFGAKEPSWDKADRDDRRREQTALNRSSNPNWKPSPKEEPKEEPTQELDRNRNLPATTPAAPKVAPTKPAAAAQTGDKTKDMATFAKANPGLAAAAAERARTRGTSQSDNPLMKGMPGKRPMTPSVQSPTLAKDLGKGSGNQSLLNNPNASKAAPPKPAATPAATPVAKPPTPTPAEPKAPTRRLSAADQRQGIRASYEYDSYDLVLEYLLSQGHADTLEEANYVMMEMDAEMVQDIVETCLDEELTGARKERAQEIMSELRPKGRPRKATNKKYGALSRVTRASEGSSEVGRTTQTSPTGRGGRMPKGSVKTGWDGDFQADRPKG